MDEIIEENVAKQTAYLLGEQSGLERGLEQGIKENQKEVVLNMFKDNLSLDANLDELLPFDYKIINKDKHECILKKKGICEYPTNDCSNIHGKIIKIEDIITTADVRLIKWLTGFTVDANFTESEYMSEKWVKNKKLVKEKRNNNE